MKAGAGGWLSGFMVRKDLAALGPFQEQAAVGTAEQQIDNSVVNSPSQLAQGLGKSSKKKCQRLPGVIHPVGEGGLLPQLLEEARAQAGLLGFCLANCSSVNVTEN